PPAFLELWTSRKFGTAPAHYNTSTSQPEPESPDFGGPKDTINSGFNSEQQITVPHATSSCQD
ncbi:hypothetical protein CEXT_398691, partial [Caerostris extrusa]